MQMFGAQQIYMRKRARERESIRLQTEILGKTIVGTSWK
jgi:hypothetical protein